MRKEDGERNIFEGIRIMHRCPFCNTCYAGSGIRMVEGGNGTHLVHASCGACRGSMVALLVERDAGVSTVGMITDLNYQDMVRLRAQEPLVADDCLRLHTFLSHNNALARALGARRPKQAYDLPAQCKKKAVQKSKRSTGGR